MLVFYQINQLESVELADIHGALAALDELACVYRARDDEHRLAEVSNRVTKWHNNSAKPPSHRFLAHYATFEVRHS